MRPAGRALAVLLLLVLPFLPAGSVPAAPFPGDDVAVAIDGAAFRLPGGEGGGNPAMTVEAGVPGPEGPVPTPPLPLAASGPREMRLVTPRGTTVLRLLPGKSPGPAGPPGAGGAIAVPVIRPSDRKENVHVFLDPRTGEILEVAFPPR